MLYFSLFLSFSLFMKKINNHKYTILLWSFIRFQKDFLIVYYLFLFSFQREKERSVSSSKKNRAISKVLFWPRSIYTNEYFLSLYFSLFLSLWKKETIISSILYIMILYTFQKDFSIVYYLFLFFFQREEERKREKGR